jgi:hypothetical protein
MDALVAVAVLVQRPAKEVVEAVVAVPVRTLAKTPVRDLAKVVVVMDAAA